MINDRKKNSQWMRVNMKLLSLESLLDSYEYDET